MTDSNSIHQALAEHQARFDAIAAERDTLRTANEALDHENVELRTRLSMLMDESEVLMSERDSALAIKNQVLAQAEIVGLAVQRMLAAITNLPNRPLKASDYSHEVAQDGGSETGRMSYTGQSHIEELANVLNRADPSSTPSKEVGEFFENARKG